MIVIVMFFVLLLLGVPISLIIFSSATVGLALFTGSNFIVIAQQIFNGLSNYVLLAIPLFIMSGNIAAGGDISRRLVNVMRMVFSRIRGGSVIAGVAACAFFCGHLRLEYGYDRCDWRHPDARADRNGLSQRNG